MSKRRIIIIGGLSAGPSAAAKARRTDEDAEIILFEKTANISYATCGIPYAMSGKIQSREKLLVVKPELLKQRFNIDVHLNEPVIQIDTEKKSVKTPKGSYDYDKLIFATGGRSILPEISGIDKADNWAHAKTLEDLDRIIKSDMLKNAHRVTIVGAGLIGLETAENLVHAGKKVTVVELGEQILGQWDAKFAEMTQQVLESEGVEFKLGQSVKSVEGTTLTLSSAEQLESDFTIIGISVKPNTEMLTDQGAKHLRNGALIVNEKMETSISDVYAAGDCAALTHLVSEDTSWFPMGTHSNKGGRTAGVNAAGGDEAFEGAYGTAIMKAFDYTIARTGMNAKALEQAGINFKSSFSISGTTPGFYPDQKDIYVEIYFDPETGKLLGAELFGERGVDKRTDVLATAIYAGLTIHDLPKLDLAYAPPYSAAKDPVVVAGFVAQNGTESAYKEVNVAQAKEMISQSDELTILDVRNPVELDKTGKIDGAINIPLDSLRERLTEVPNQKPLLVYCAKGMRGYLASLILHHNDYKDIHNMAGGYTAWQKIILRD